LRFIVDAHAQIAECRRVLKWTYGFGYYHLEEDGPKKRFFEFVQADAEMTLERLTEAVEVELETFLNERRDVSEFGEFRGKLAGLTSITHKYFDALVVEIERGFPGVQSEAAAKVDETSEETGEAKVRAPNGVLGRIRRGIREAVIGNDEDIASRTRSRDAES
jgi:ariadne-1